MNDRLCAHFSAVRDTIRRVLFACEQLVSAQIQLHCADSCGYLTRRVFFERPACSAYVTAPRSQQPSCLFLAEVR